MSNEKHTFYHFLPYARLGLASRIKEDSIRDSRRAKLSVNLDIKAHVIDPGEGPEETILPLDPNKVNVELYGPLDVMGFHPRIVARTEPRPNAGSFEPNYFPFIEFADPDFVWRFTPEAAKDNGDLLPWLTLIVLVEEAWNDQVSKEFKEPTYSEREDQERPDLPPRITVNGPARSLPDLRKAAKWAHVQITGEYELEDQYRSILQNIPEQAVCRLLCPRRLCPKTKYAAFLVPTYELGRMAGLGEDTEGTDIGPDTLAWDWASQEFQTEKDFPLPYYFRWEFITGKKGDFEYLLRLLEPKELSGLGIRNIDCSNPGLLEEGVARTDLDPEEEDQKHLLGLEGALKSVDTQSTPWGYDNDPNALTPFQSELAGLIALGGVPDDFNVDEDRPRVVPPIYGRWHAGRNVVGRLKVSVDPGGTSQARQLSGMVTAAGQALAGVLVFLREENKLAQSDHRGAFSFLNLKRDKVSLQVKTFGKDYELGEIDLSGHRAEFDFPAADSWLEELNLDPRHRVAAGLGAEVIRRKQEDLMASAWEQLGDIQKINELLRLSQHGRETGRRLHRRLKRLPQEGRLAVMSPMLHRLETEGKDMSQFSSLLSKGATSLEKMTFSQVLFQAAKAPKGPLDPAFRRIARPRGPIRKKQQPNYDGLQALTAVSNTASAAGKGPIGRKKTASLDTVSSQQATLFEEGRQKVVQSLADIGVRELDPERTVFERVKSRVLIDSGITARFSAKPDTLRDDLDQVYFTPDFPQPAYKYLEEISPQLILPGIEKVPFNSIGILKTNRRFIEAYLCGCNHEMAGELLWREYPTDQRGTYFRQFWSVDERVPEPTSMEDLWNANQEDPGLLKKMEKVLQYLEEGDSLKGNIEAFLDGRKEEIEDIARFEDDLTREFIAIRKLELWEENCRDIPPITDWKEARLGDNRNPDIELATEQEYLVLVIKGELLRRYPNTLIYAILATPRQHANLGKEWKEDERDNWVPALPEFAEHYPTQDNLIVIDNEKVQPMFPIFRADIEPDMTFLGFPFPKETARSSSDNKHPGLFFVLEERVGETRFGLDLQEDPTPGNLSWTDFGFGAGKTGTFETNYGAYLDLEPDPDIHGDMPTTVPVEAMADGDEWKEGTSAYRASRTFQKPFRVAIHADQMLPPDK